MHYSDVSPTSNGTITCCFYSLSILSLSGSWNAYVTLLSEVWYGWLLFLTHSLNVPLKSPTPVNTSLNSLWNFCIINLLASMSSPMFALYPKYLICLDNYYWCSYYLICNLPLCVIQFRTLVGFIVWESKFMPAFWPLTTSHVIFSKPSNSISSIPNSAGPSSGLQRIYIWQLNFCALILLNKHLIVLCLKCCKLLILPHYFYGSNFSVFDFGKRVLKFLNGIRLPSAPESMLYVIWVLLWLIVDCSLADMTDYMLSRLMYFTLTTLLCQQPVIFFVFTLCCFSL